jgi:hypothetical protein
MRHWENICSLVCGSDMAVVIREMHCWTWSSCLLKYCLAKLADLIGDPRRWHPVVSLMGIGGPVGVLLLGFVEYVLMVCSMLVVRVGLERQIPVRGDVLEVDVSILVYIGLTKHPSGKQS